jgi:hypothetical protein
MQTLDHQTDPFSRPEVVQKEGAPIAFTLFTADELVAPAVEKRPEPLLMATYTITEIPSGYSSTETLALRLEATEEYPDIYIAPSEEKKQGVFGRIMANLFNRASDRVRPDKPEDKERGRFNIWSIAKAGIDGYNLMADKEVELLTDTDDDGRVTSYTLLDSDEVVMTRSRPNVE